MKLPLRKRDPSPPLVEAPRRVETTKRADRNSLDSISSISDDSDSFKKSPGPKGAAKITGVIDLRSTSRSESPVVVQPRYVLSFVVFVFVAIRKCNTLLFSRSKLPGRLPSPPKIHQMLPTPKQLAAQSTEIANERYKWEKYR